ncbi:hypothetical protein Bca101_081847 [Brassica carinata]
MSYLIKWSHQGANASCRPSRHNMNPCQLPLPRTDRWSHYEPVGYASGDIRKHEPENTELTLLEKPSPP